jgi:hypothetical protein
MIVTYAGSGSGIVDVEGQAILTYIAHGDDPLIPQRLVG